MSKRAEEAALRVYPDRTQQIGYDTKYDVNYESRRAYQEGYEQAEKDLALTCDDIARISGILCDVYEEEHQSNPQTFYKEVLRRFNEWRARNETR